MKLNRRITATALALTLLFGMLPAPAAAVTPAQVVTGEGTVIEIGDDWETK